MANVAKAQKYGDAYLADWTKQTAIEVSWIARTDGHRSVAGIDPTDARAFATELQALAVACRPV